MLLVRVPVSAAAQHTQGTMDAGAIPLDVEWITAILKPLSIAPMETAAAAASTRSDSSVERHAPDWAAPIQRSLDSFGRMYSCATPA